MAHVCVCAFSGYFFGVEFKGKARGKPRFVGCIPYSPIATPHQSHWRRYPMPSILLQIADLDPSPVPCHHPPAALSSERKGGSGQRKKGGVPFCGALKETKRSTEIHLGGSAKKKTHLGLQHTDLPWPSNNHSRGTYSVLPLTRAP